MIAACSSSPPSDGPAATAPSQASAALSMDTASAAVATAAPSTTAMIKTAEYQGVVLPVKEVNQAGLTLGGEMKLDGVWLPSASDVAAFESGLVAHMTKAVSAEHKDLPARLKGYKRQWFGVTAAGKKLVYANFFCDAEPGWEQYAVMVDDGGDCYFQLFYDVTSRQYLNLMINGQA
jgi:hypothetical protein